MSYWRQPWGRLELEGHPCRLQVLDPRASFELEPELIERLGNPVLQLLADPSGVTSAIGAAVGQQLGVAPDIATAIADPEKGVFAAAAGLRLASGFLARALATLDIDGGWVAQVFERAVLERLTVDGAEIGSWREWGSSGLGWLGRWTVLGAQMAQTYGPLWRRSPYKSGGREVSDYGVPKTNAPIAVQWASMIAKLGLASSADEVLVAWTPERVIDVVEEAARDAEIQRRHQDAAEARRAG